jgi:hypothetical protein
VLADYRRGILMKAITLTQPWATLVAIGAKRIETRSWSTFYRGPLAIHAGKGLGKGGERAHKALCGTEPFCSVLNEACKAHYDGLDKSVGVLRAMAESPFMPMGAIIATCDLVGCVSTEYIKQVKMIRMEGYPDWLWTEQEKAFGDYSDKRFAWLLADVKLLPTPIPYKGALSLWEASL